ncbi:alpha/beta fold hydrolase [Halomicroarcula sp. GCM10025817]|uniref:alpha/beta fold hydrolase n=1 Tax=Haloarcula TaxID=2237 RepID=UPI0023E761DB|nr:alpha/beta hydrolase [Halomicroarcula sp. SYNS111]
METTMHDGRETAYRHARPGVDGQTTLYVHGSGATHAVWGHQYGTAGPTHPAAALDLSGHGASDDVDAGPADAIDAYTADVAAVARAVDADVLVGNSLGGAVVQRAATGWNLDLSALVLLGTGPTLPVFEGLREWLASDFDRAVEFLHGPDRLFHDADADTLARSESQMRAVGQRVTRRDFLACHGFDGRDRLADIDVPTLAVCGEHDRLTPRAYHEDLAESIPQGEFAIVPDAAHLAMVERPAVFNEAVESFLASLD